MWVIHLARIRKRVGHIRLGLVRSGPDRARDGAVLGGDAVRERLVRDPAIRGGAPADEVVGLVATVVQIAGQAVERVILQHQDDDVIELAQIRIRRTLHGPRRRLSAFGSAALSTGTRGTACYRYNAGSRGTLENSTSCKLFGSAGCLLA